MKATSRGGRRTALLALALALCACGLASAQSNHFTLFIPGMTTPVNLDGVITKEVMRQSGIVWDKVETGNGSSESEQVNLKLAGGTLPDAIVLGGDSIIWPRLVKEKRLIALDSYYKDKAGYPTLAAIDPRIVDFWRASDGRVYFVPSVYEPVLEEPSAWQGNAKGLWVRDDLLKRAGMTYDDIRTLAGFETFLGRLKGVTDAAGRSIIPLSLDKENFNGLQVVMSMFGVVGDVGTGWNETAGGAVAPDYQTKGFKQAWQWLNRMYRGGLLDPETPYQKSDLFDEKANSLRYGAFLFNGWSNPNIFVLKEHGYGAETNYAQLKAKGFPEDWYYPTYLPKMPGVKPAQMASFNPFGGAGVAVTTACKNPGALMKAIDWMNTPQAFLLMEYGPESLGNYTMTDGVAVEHPEVFQSEAYWGGTNPMKNVTEKGFWWWKNVASVNSTHIPKLEPPWIVKNVMLYRAEEINHEQGVFGLVSKADRITPLVGGKVEKYTPIQRDIRLQYFAKLMMAKTDADFESAFATFLNEMKVRGHDAETIAEFNQQYLDYAKTPGGKIQVTIRRYLPRNVWSDKPEIIGR
jgi:putative aldouronate transport system substrate-binding protein